MDDHEKRREAIIKKKFQEHLDLLEVIRAKNREASRNEGESRGGDNSDIESIAVRYEFSCISLPCTAKAA